MARWLLKQSRVDVKNLSAELNIHPAVIKILANRGFNKKESIKEFLFGTADDLFSPHLMKDLDSGLALLTAAIKDGEKIAVVGDYDADGVIGTAILCQALKKCGAVVEYSIPHREHEGYGINKDMVRSLREEGFALILACDNGIAAHKEIKLAKDLGMIVIIADHHEVPLVEKDGETIRSLPPADAIINPKQEKCGYPFKALCAGGIAYKFAVALYEAFDINEKEAQEFLELAAIATVCDVVDLTGENRIIVREGLIRLKETRHVGLRALLETTKLTGKELSTYHVGFILGPCINATGRLDTARLAVDLLLEKDEEKARNLARILNELNMERKKLTDGALERVISAIEREGYKQGKVIVAYDNCLHESIAGIVAGRVREKYNLPVIILTEGREMVKGSGRSIENYDMFLELSKCKDLLERFGGHRMAAGLALRKENIDLLRRRMLENCSLTAEDVETKIRIDLRLALSDIDYRLAAELIRLEPFGQGNPEPVFAEKNVHVTRIRALGKEQKIIKFDCQTGLGHRTIEAISFDGYEKLRTLLVQEYSEELFNEIIKANSCDLRLDLVFYIAINEFNGLSSLQLRVKDFRISQTQAREVARVV